jgi:hypothetical protein
MPAARHNFAADRLGGTAQPLADHCGLLVSRPSPQEMDAVDADTNLGMVAEVDQGVFASDLAAAPATALACLAHRRLGLSAHRGSRLLAASLGVRSELADGRADELRAIET